MSGINPMEAASSLAMCVVATWTVSTAAHRALSMRHILRDSGEMQPVVDQRSAMCLPVISSATLLTLYFLFKYIQNFLVCYMVIASFEPCQYASTSHSHCTGRHLLHVCVVAAYRSPRTGHPTYPHCWQEQWC